MKRILGLAAFLSITAVSLSSPLISFADTNSGSTITAKERQAIAEKIKLEASVHKESIKELKQDAKNSKSGTITPSFSTSSFPYGALTSGDMIFVNSGHWYGSYYAYWGHMGTYDSNFGEFLSAEDNSLGVCWQTVNDYSGWSRVALDWVPSVYQSTKNSMMTKMEKYWSDPYNITSSLGDTSTWYCSELAAYAYWYDGPHVDVTGRGNLNYYSSFISPDEIYDHTSTYWSE